RWLSPFFPAFFYKDRLVSHGRHICYLYISHISLILGNKEISILVSKAAGAAYRKGHSLVHIPAGSVIYGVRLFCIFHRILMEIFQDSHTDLLDLLIVFSGILIYFMNGRSRDNIMELIGKDQL